VDINLLKNRTFALNNITRFILFVTVSSNIFLMPFYLQVVLGYSPAQTGMLIAPMSILIGAVAPIAGWLTNIVPTRVLSAIGMAILGLGLFLTSRLGLSSTYHDILWRLLLIGLGHGVFQTPNNTSIMDSVSRDKFGLASGLMALVREIGRAMGTSLASVIVVTSMFATVGPISLYNLKREGASAMPGPFLQAFADSITTALLVAALLCIPGVILCLLRGKTDRDEGKLTNA
jgi:MFS family permease